MAATNLNIEIMQMKRLTLFCFFSPLSRIVEKGEKVGGGRLMDR